MNTKVINSKHLNMVFHQMLHPHADLTIPETWTNVKTFADWWMEAKMPIVFPENPEVFVSDDATAVSIFRHGQFQVELYLIHPNPKVPVHEHPGVEVIKMSLSIGDGPLMSNILKNGESHGAGRRLASEKRGFPLVAFQHWQTCKPTTIASMWKGSTVGPLQEALIKRFNPDAYVVTGYADITKKHDSPM
jgi:hypothetical protein